MDIYIVHYPIIQNVVSIPAIAQLMDTYFILCPIALAIIVLLVSWGIVRLLLATKLSFLLG